MTKRNGKLWNSKIGKTISKKQSDSKGIFYTTAASRRYTYTMVLKKNGFLSPLVPWVIFSGAGGNNLLINRSLKLSTLWVKYFLKEHSHFQVPVFPSFLLSFIDKVKLIDVGPACWLQSSLVKKPCLLATVFKRLWWL